MTILTFLVWRLEIELPTFNMVYVQQGDGGGEGVWEYLILCNKAFLFILNGLMYMY
jgi:hypothetical protein